MNSNAVRATVDKLPQEYIFFHEFIRVATLPDLHSLYSLLQTLNGPHGYRSSFFILQQQDTNLRTFEAIPLLKNQANAYRAYHDRL